MADIERENEALLRRVSGGDRSAFWALWLQNKDYLYRICLQLMRRSPEDAEDVLSGAMLKALAKMSVHAGKIHDVRAWLAQLTRNYCIDIHRQRQREMAQLHAVSYGEAQASQALLGNGEEKQGICLDSALQNLPANQKEVIVFRFIGGKSYEEIAAHLNVSPTAVRKRIQRARIALKQMGLDARSFPGCSCHRAGHPGFPPEWYCVAILSSNRGRSEPEDGVVGSSALLDVAAEPGVPALPASATARQDYSSVQFGDNGATDPAEPPAFSITAAADRAPGSGVRLVQGFRERKVRTRRQAVDAAG